MAVLRIKREQARLWVVPQKASQPKLMDCKSGRSIPLREWTHIIPSIIVVVEFRKDCLPIVIEAR